MSSVIFQPLLHDSLGWKQSNSTYADTYKWKNYRSSSKDTRISTYGQQYQRQLKKQQKLQQKNNCLPPVANEEQTIERLPVEKKNEENRGLTSVSNRSTPSKTPPAVTEELPTLIVEYKQRPVSINREAISNSRTSQRSLTVPTTVEETSLTTTTQPEARRSSKEEKEKVTNDPNNDNSRHWLTYPNPKTPQYLIDIRQRLGQIKVPFVITRPTTASTAPAELLESSVSSFQRQKTAEERHFLDFNLPETPNELRAARQRLERNRYNPSVDNYPPRPKTCPVRTKDDSKPVTPPVAPESEDEQLKPTQTPPTKQDIWVNYEEIKPTENETSSFMTQSSDCDGFSNEYAEAVESANFAQEEYLKNLINNNEKNPDNLVYRLPALPLDNKTNSFTAFRNHQQSTSSTPSTPSSNNNSTRQNDFGTWVRNATDKERESAMKILNQVLNQPVMGYDIPIKQTVSKKLSGSTSLRTASGTRKLGRTRNPHRRIPCDICENQLIKHHVWNLSRSNSLVCPHQAQGTKPPIIQVQNRLSTIDI